MPERVCCGSSATSPTAPTSRSACSTRRHRATCSRRRRWRPSTVEIPAVVAVKEGVQDSVSRTPALHALAPQLVIWECDLIVYSVGWLQQGIIGPAQLGTAGYLFEVPDNLAYSHYWNLIWSGAAHRGGGVLERSGSRGPQCRHGFVAGAVSRPPRLLHPLGRGVQVRRLGHRAPGRGLSRWRGLPKGFSPTRPRTKSAERWKRPGWRGRHAGASATPPPETPTYVQRSR